MSIEIQTTADGHPAVAFPDGVVYAAVPSRNGLRRVVEYTSRPVSDLKAESFMNSGESYADVEGFREDMEDLVAHYEHLKRLDRVTVPGGTRTPWGKSDEGVIYADGIMRFHTPSHGGMKLLKRMNNLVPEAYRNADGWYEEDCEMAKIAVSLPHLFTDRERRMSEEAVIRWFPDEYEAVNGVVIPEGQSFKKDERLFNERHADDWLVISALGQDDGTVACIATIGGERSGWKDGREIKVEEKHFTVTKEEYDTRGRFSFVIDPARHEEVEPETPGFGRR